MKQFKLTLVLTVLMSMIGLKAFADWSNLVYNVDGLYYHFDWVNKLAMVSKGPGECTGYIKIPSTVIYNNKHYTVTAIGNGGFNTTGLTRISIPNEVTTIGENAFLNCENLTSVDLPYCLTTIGRCAFYGCKKLTSAFIPDKVTSIEEYTFYNCQELKYVTIPKSVTSIGEYAFDRCYSLASVSVFNPSPIAIGPDVFKYIYKTTLYVPKGSKAAYEAADYWKEFKEIVEIEVSDIDQIMSDGENNATIFTLDGKRINKPQKGINIIDGKKVIVK